MDGDPYDDFFFLFWLRYLNFMKCQESQIYWPYFLPSLLQTTINHLKHKSRGCVCWLLTSPADLTDLLVAVYCCIAKLAQRSVSPYSACLMFIFFDSYQKKKGITIQSTKDQTLAD